jgi:hypothetical protein
VVAHVLDASGENDVVGAEGDAGSRRRDRRQRTGAHPVHGEAGDAAGQPRQQGGHPPDCQALVADLGRGGDGDVVDPLGRQLRVPAQQLPDARDDHVVGAGLGVQALRAGLAEGGSDAVDEDDVAQGAGHGSPPAVERNGQNRCYSTVTSGQ